MPSRKKARGRQNRAKKEATRTADLRSLWEPTILRNNVNATTSPCEHMLAVLPRIPQVGPAISYMNCLAGEGFFDKATTHFIPVEVCFQTLMRYPEVRKDDTERSLTNDLLLRFVRSVFLQDSTIEGETWFHNEPPKNEAAICCMVHLIELLGTYSDTDVAKRRASRMNNKLVGGNRRDVVKFVAKRLPCTCLKKLHGATRKKVAKIGLCGGCLKQFPRSQLHVCTGCMYIEYCSKDCQMAHRSRHKRYCGNPEVMSRDLPADYVLR